MRIIDILKNIEFPDTNLPEYRRSSSNLTPDLKIKIDKEYTTRVIFKKFLPSNVLNLLPDDFSDFITILHLDRGYLIFDELGTSSCLVLSKFIETHLFDLKQIKEQDDSYNLLQYGLILHKQVKIL